MIIVSLICVVVAAITLAVGYVIEESSVLYASIAAALLGGLFLLIAMFQGRQRQKPLRSATVAGDDVGGAPTWKGAGWGGDAAPQDDVLSRATESAATPEPETDETRQIDEEAFKPPATPPAPSPAAMPPPSAPAPSAQTPATPARPASQSSWAPPAAAPPAKPSSPPPPPPPA